MTVHRQDPWAADRLVEAADIINELMLLATDDEMPTPESTARAMRGRALDWLMDWDRKEPPGSAKMRVAARAVADGREPPGDW